MTMIDLPDPDLPDLTNAARMADFALAAYWAVGDKFKAARNYFEREHEDADDFIWWDVSNCSGVYVEYDLDAFVGIAGTNDPDDWRHNRDLEPQYLSEWSETYGIDLSPGAGRAISSKGFLAHAALALKGLDFACFEGKRVWIGAHSLGGAVANVLQTVDCLSHARAFTYGAPRSFRGLAPLAQRVAIQYPLDPVIHVPRTYNFPRQETFYARYQGSFSKKRTMRGRVFNMLGAIRAVLKRGSLSWAFEQAKRNHSMEKYRQDLYPLR